MNWRKLLFWKRRQVVEPGLFPSREALALEDARRKLGKPTWKDFALDRCNPEPEFFCSFMISLIVFLFACLQFSGIFPDFLGLATFALWRGAGLLLGLHRRHKFFLEALGSAREALASADSYYQRLKIDFSTMINGLALYAEVPFLREIEAIDGTVASALSEHTCPVGEDCNVHQAIEEAVRLKALFQSKVCQLEERKKNLLSRAEVILQTREQAEKNQLARQEEEKRLLEEIRQQVNQELHTR